jgi:hypothetical protein
MKLFGCFLFRCVMHTSLFLFWIYGHKLNMCMRSSNSTATGTDTLMHYMSEWKYRDVHVLCSSAYNRFAAELRHTPKTYIENAEWRMTFWMAKISNGSSSKCWTPVWVCSHLLTLVHRSRIFSFHPEEGGDTFLRNVCLHNIYTAPHPRRRHSSESPPWKPQILHLFYILFHVLHLRKTKIL